jgi:hypothetical protein
LEDIMVQGPNDLPDIIAKAAALQANTPVKPKAPVPAPAPARQDIQVADSVQLSPRAVQASQLLAQAQAEPDVRNSVVEQVRSKLSSIAGDSASLNAKLAEKLLTEN